MKKFTTIGFINGKKRQDSTNDFKLAEDRLANYKKGYVKMNGVKPFIIKKVGFKR